MHSTSVTFPPRRVLKLVFQQPQATLHDDVLQDGARWDVDRAALRRDDDDSAFESHAAAEVDAASDGEVVEFQDLRDGRDAGLEAGHLLEVVAELDERRRAEAVRVHHELPVLDGVEVRFDKHEIGARLDRQEAPARHIDAVGVAEVADGSADSRLQLHDTDVRLALLVRRDALAVRDDLHAQLIVLHDALDRTQVHPDVVGVEVLELLDALELVDVLLWHLRDFEQASLALVVDDGATLDVSLRLVCQLHDVLRSCLHHVLQDVEINDGAEVVGVGKEDDFDAAVEQLVEDAGVEERLEDVAVAWRVPIGDLRVGVLWCGEEGVLEDAGVFRLVEGHDVDIVALVFLDNVCGVGIGVEGVHKHEWHVHVVRAVQVFNLADGEIEEGHAVTNFDD